jgi:hypothetical protein
MEMSDRTIGNERDFTPALPLLWAYDLIAAAFTRERTWRGAFLRQLDPRPDASLPTSVVAPALSWPCLDELQNGRSSSVSIQTTEFCAAHAAS